MRAFIVLALAVLLLACLAESKPAKARRTQRRGLKDVQGRARPKALGGNAKLRDDASKGQKLQARSGYWDYDLDSVWDMFDTYLTGYYYDDDSYYDYNYGDDSWDDWYDYDSVGSWDDYWFGWYKRNNGNQDQKSKLRGLLGQLKVKLQERKAAKRNAAEADKA